MRTATAPDRTSLIFAAALAAGQLAVVGPLSVWADNRGSFAGLSGAAVLTLGAAFLALATLFLLPGLLVSPWVKPLSAALFTLTLLMWGQSFLSGRLLTGVEIAGSASGVRQLGEGLAWALSLVGAIVFSRRLLPILARAALLVVVVQVLALVWGSLRAESQSARGGAAQEQSWEGLATLSRNRNIIVLVLDTMHRDYVTQVLSASPELAARFRGFRVFTDHLGTFPTTRFSLPAMLAGKNYDNTEPADTFVEATLARGPSAPRRLQEAGWNVGIATTISSTLVVPADIRLLVGSYVRKKNSARSLGLELLDLSAFRHAPAVLGTWVYNSDKWRLRQFVHSARRNYHATRSLDFIEDYVESMDAATAGPVFRFLHVGGAHPPLVVDSECRFLGVQELRSSAYAAQVECALRQALLLVERLRQLGILDQTFLIVTSDHGVSVARETSSGVVEPDLWTRVLDFSAAAMMIKTFDSQGPLNFDPSPTSIADLPAIISRAADRDGLSDGYLPAAVEPDRQRPFFFHEWTNRDWRKPYLTALHGFQVSSGTSKRSAWVYTGTVVSPEFDARERSRLLIDVAAYFSQAPATAAPHSEAN